MTPTFTTAVPPRLSAIEIWQVPAATDVTVNEALGPVPDDGVNVAIPLQLEPPELVAVNGPVYPLSETVKPLFAPAAVKVNAPGVTAIVLVDDDAAETNTFSTAT